MARKKRSPKREALIKQLIAEYQLKTAQDAHETVKDLLGDMIQGLLEGELEEELGYSKYDYHDKETDNSRNGFSKKTVRSSSGNIDLDIPRDRNGEFEHR